LNDNDKNNLKKICYQMTNYSPRETMTYTDYC